MIESSNLRDAELALGSEDPVCCAGEAQTLGQDAVFKPMSTSDSNYNK